MSRKHYIYILLALLIGIVIGGYLFHSSTPRSFLAVNQCSNTCLKPNELAGLIASVGIQTAPGLIPKVYKETDKSLAIENPFPQAKVHYLIVPKKDIKDISQLSESDKEYLDDAYALMTNIIREKRLTNYQIVTNGPGYQHVTYLHFHLISKD
jgi:histidine triad (HIT) family protein